MTSQMKCVLGRLLQWQDWEFVLKIPDSKFFTTCRKKWSRPQFLLIRINFQGGCFEKGHIFSEITGEYNSPHYTIGYRKIRLVLHTCKLKLKVSREALNVWHSFDLQWWYSVVDKMLNYKASCQWKVTAYGRHNLKCQSNPSPFFGKLPLS